MAPEDVVSRLMIVEVELQNQKRELEQVEFEIQDIKTKFYAENKEMRGEIGTLDKKQVRSEEILKSIDKGIEELKSGFKGYQEKLNQRSWQIWLAIIAALISGAVGWIVSLTK